LEDIFVGCHLLPVDDLLDFYCRLCSLFQPLQVFQVCSDSVNGCQHLAHWSHNRNNNNCAIVVY